LRDAQTLCSLKLVSIRVIENILAQRIEINLASPEPMQLAMDILNPARHTCHTNIKSGRHLRYRKSFFFRTDKTLRRKFNEYVITSIIIIIILFSYIQPAIDGGFMGQILHGSAPTTEEVRRLALIRRNKQSLMHQKQKLRNLKSYQ
jgi:hypothetical protein